jgi:uncharacterized membrane protein YozB (DUF420 family)
MIFYRRMLIAITAVANVIAIIIISLSFLTSSDVTTASGVGMSDFQIFMKRLWFVVAISIAVSLITLFAGWFIKRKGGLVNASPIKLFITNFFCLILFFLIIYLYLRVRN